MRGVNRTVEATGRWVVLYRRGQARRYCCASAVALLHPNQAVRGGWGSLAPIERR